MPSGRLRVWMGVKDLGFRLWDLGLGLPQTNTNITLVKLAFGGSLF